MKSLCYKIFSLLLLSLVILPIQAQNADFSEVINNDIVKGKTNLCVIRDKYGFMWIGTMTGLSCYDGNNNPVYTGIAGTVPGTEGVNVCSIFEQDEDIWFGGPAGLYVFNRKANRATKFPHRTSYGVPVSSTVQKIMKAPEGEIWILTHGQGFFVYDPSDSTLTQNSRYGSFYSDMAIGRDNHVYAVNLDGNLQSFTSNGKFISSLRLPGYVSDKNRMGMVSSGNDLWIATGTRLYRYNQPSGKVEAVNNLPLHNNINSLVSVGKHIYLGTDGGLHKFDTETLQLSPATATDRRILSRLPEKSINQLCLDRDGSMFVVTPSGGVSQLIWQPKDIRKVELSDSDGVNYGNVNVFCVSADGDKLWVGTDNGLLRYDPATGEVSAPIADLKNIAITSIERDGRFMWVGTRRHGLYSVEKGNKRVRPYTYEEGTPYVVISNDINQLYRTSANELFVLTDWGLCWYNKAHDYFNTRREIDSYVAFLAMKEDAKGRLWASTPNNLLVRDNPQADFRSFDSSTLKNASVMSMHLAQDGTFRVVANGNEIFEFDDASGDFKPTDIAINPEHQVIFLEEDKNGNLWIGTTGGMMKAGKGSAPVFYSSLSTLNRGMSRLASMRLSDGRIVFGGENNFCVFDPTKVESDGMKPQAYIRSISFPYLEDSDREVENLGLNSLLYTCKEIKLPFDDNTFTLHFSASRYGEMPQTNFEYKLEGVDKAWMHTSESQVTYNGLRPGTYNFLLAPADMKTAGMQSLKIVVLPPWYNTRWAYLGYFIVILLVAWMVGILVRRKVRRHYRKRMEKERMENEHEMYEAKMRFFVNLVHETRTPLTLINIPLEQMSEKSEKEGVYSENDRKRLRSMRRNLDYLLRITNQLLDFRKAEHDSEVKLHLTGCDVNEMIRKVCHRFEHPMAENGITLRTELPDEVVETAFDVDKMDRVIMNLLGNAMKYARTSVTVSLEKNDGGHYVLKVTDDGPGIPPAEREHIFDTYYQINVNELSVALGTGLGLAYARLIANAHGGTIAAEDNEEGGTTFVLTLPIVAVDESVATYSPNDHLIASDGSDEVELPDVSGEGDVTILLVDDNREMLSTVAEALSEDYRVLTASDGVEALQKLGEDENISLVISDFMMPNMDGAELCRRIKSDLATSHLPFVMLTAKTANEARIEGMASGADIYIDKPFSIKQLKLQIANILRMRRIYYERLRSAAPETPDVPAEETVEEMPYMNQLDKKFMETLNRHVQENICDEEFSIDALAEKMNLSRSSFYRKIKALTGMTPVDYLKNFRLDYAAKLLLEGGRVTEVALMAGFSSSSYFAKCFKAKFGVIPKEYAAQK